MANLYNSLYCETLKGKAEPFSVLHALGASDSSVKPFLLSSGEGFGFVGHWSFLGTHPKACLTLTGKKATFACNNNSIIWHGNAFELMRRALQQFSWRGSTDTEIPFFGGWAGAFAYDLAHAVEKLPRTAVRDLDLPDIQMAFYDQILAFDHVSRKWTACVLLQEGQGRKYAVDRTARLQEAVEKARKRPYTPPAIPCPESPISRFTQAEYEAAVKKAIDYIYAGDIFQVNLSQRFDLTIPGNSFDVMGHLLTENPAPFSAYLAFDGKAIMSSSPERFLKVTGRYVETRPIKGTRPRGSNPKEDEALREELLKSGKDIAELNMIIDLLRNDLGRVCEYGTVRVVEPRRMETYTTVHHAVGIIEGLLHQRYDLVDLLKACWPGGSITGAPKVRAMQIIDEIEPTTRSFYTGSIGYICVNGNLDLNIAIRTLLFDRRILSFQVGGAIVAESSPHDEYQETLHKAEGMLRALGRGARV
ncbi:MAG: aminodeoxychorismate synthase component I [Planctomycetes bacterium]|nr:aminodeoxychorismate synthase component I [Planctomycetota bacterium]